MRLVRLLPVLGAIAMATMTAATWHPGATSPAIDQHQGRGLWLQNCATCHAASGTGSDRGPDISRRGTAAVDFQVRTGRMPLDDPDQQMERRSPAFDPEEIAALVDYTSTFVDGPPAGGISIRDADLTRGGELYRAECAACHQAVGAGGALSNGDTVPSLYQATPREVREAVRTGPGSMTPFSRQLLDDDKMADVAAYVDHLKEPGDRGGFDLGHLGPVPEGLVALVAGLGSLVLVTRWLGTRSD